VRLRTILKLMGFRSIKPAPIDFEPACYGNICLTYAVFQKRTPFIPPRSNLHRRRCSNASMSKIVLFNKPFNVLTQFRPEGDRLTLAHFFTDKSLRVAGRLDRDSEGLLLLTDDGILNARMTQPAQKQTKIYLAQVEGIPTESALQALLNGVLLNDGLTLPAKIKLIDEPKVWARTPAIRYRANLPTSWLEIGITEGRNRQVRRMTAAVGHPTLRLIRVQISEYKLGNLQPGEFCTAE
jgi:23S rRNA pseudouridine2457 synthase